MPYLSGEIIYNLRNTYYHQGNLNINKAKIKKVENQIDKFILLLGDDKKIYEMSMDFDIGNGMMTVKNYIINVTYLCNLLCYAAENFYSVNKEHFKMDWKVIEGDIFK